MDIKKELTEAVLDNINLKQMSFDIIDNVLEEGLNEVVADMENPLTQMLMDSIYPPLELALKALIAKKLDELVEQA